MSKLAFPRGGEAVAGLDPGPVPPRTPNASGLAGANRAPRRPCGTAGEQRAPGATARSIWRCVPRWLSSLEEPRKLAINAVVLIATLLGFAVVAKAALTRVYVIDSISVPKDLEAQGYTAATVGQRIIDAVTEINRTAAMTKQNGVYVLTEADPSKPDADYEGPGHAHFLRGLESSFALSTDDELTKYNVSAGGLSLPTMVFYVRELFGRGDTRISGEIIAEQPPVTGVAGKDEKPAPPKFSIRLRITDKGVVQHDCEPAGKLDALFEQAALKMVERFDPLNAAYYSYYKRDFDNALRIARIYIADEAQADKRWALNLLGLIAHARYREDEARALKGYDQAISEFTELTKSHPEFAPALYNLGFVLIDKGLKQHDSEVAGRLFRQAHDVALRGIQIDEAMDRAHRGPAVGYATAARALRYMGQSKEALGHFDRSIKADPRFIYAYLGQGKIYHDLHEPEHATDRYQLATEISPSAQTFTRVGYQLRRSRRYEEAVPMFERAAYLRPSAYAFTYWAMAVRDSGRHDDARKLFEKAIAWDPTVPNSHNQLGIMYLRQKKWDEAAEQFTAAINAAPQWSNYQYNLGRALLGAGKFEQAIAAFEKAITIYPSHAWSYVHWGAALLAAGKGREVSEETIAKVVQMLEKAAALRPDDASLLMQIRDVYKRLGRTEQAVEFDRRAIAAKKKPGELHADIEWPDQTTGQL